MIDNGKTLEVIGDKIAVKPIGEERLGLIHLPEAARRRPSRGTVVAVPKPGEGGVPLPNEAGYLPSTVQPGDAVIFRFMAGRHREVMFNGEEHWIISQQDLFAKVETA